MVAEHKTFDACHGSNAVARGHPADATADAAADATAARRTPKRWERETVTAIELDRVR